MAYGVFGLLGFLAQMVIGIAGRVLPMFAWIQARVRSEYEVVPPSQYTMHHRGLQVAGFVLWTAAVPLLAYGLTFDVWPLVSSAGACLSVALVCQIINGVRIVRHAFGVSAGGERADAGRDLDFRSDV